jgi:hypothetical protein
VAFGAETDGTARVVGDECARAVWCVGGRREFTGGERFQGRCDWTISEKIEPRGSSCSSQAPHYSQDRAPSSAEVVQEARPRPTGKRAEPATGTRTDAGVD